VSADKSTDRSAQLIAVARSVNSCNATKPAAHRRPPTVIVRTSARRTPRASANDQRVQAENPIVLVFDLVPGLVAQWESVRLTRGRSLVRNQPGPPTVYLRQHPHARTVLSSWIFIGVRFLSGRESTVLVHPVKVGGDCVQLRVVKVAVDVGCDDRGGVTECALHKPQVGARGAGQGCIGVAEIVNG
jgi:hypothetical protein